MIRMHRAAFLDGDRVILLFLVPLCPLAEIGAIVALWCLGHDVTLAQETFLDWGVGHRAIAKHIAYDVEPTPVHLVDLRGRA